MSAFKAKKINFNLYLFLYKYKKKNIISSSLLNYACMLAYLGKRHVELIVVHWEIF